MYEQELFYSTCDELGIMVTQHVVGFVGLFQVVFILLLSLKRSHWCLLLRDKDCLSGDGVRVFFLVFFFG